MQASDFGILSFGAYLPAWRLPRQVIAEATGWLNPGSAARARGERSVANWDEDTITMAVEAGRRILEGCADAAIDQLLLASTTCPFADRSNSGVISRALRLSERLHNADVTGSRRAATSALLRALQQPRPDATLLLAADAREAKPGSPQELQYGHGAAGVVVGSGQPLALYLGGASLHRDLVDQYRTVDTDFDYSLEERWVREEGFLKIVPQVVAELFSAGGVDASEVDHVIIPTRTATARAIVSRVGLEHAALADPLNDRVGDCGAAQSLLMLTEVLSRCGGGQTLLLIGFGQGADVILLRTTEQLQRRRGGRAPAHLEAHQRRLNNYTQYLSLRRLLEMDFGNRSERDNRTALASFYRKRDDITGFMGGRCRKCGTLQFPRSVLCVKCAAEDSQDPESFADKPARVKSFTEDWLAYTPCPPLIYGNVEFPDGGNVMMEFTDFASGQLTVGQPLRMVFRIKDFDPLRHFHRYFWKSAPHTGTREEMDG